MVSFTLLYYVFYTRTLSNPNPFAQTVSSFEVDKPQGSATFQMSNGVPSVKKRKSKNNNNPDPV